MRYIRRVRVMYCHTLVSPGIGAVLHTGFFRNVLIMDDLPELGYPMKPAEICLRSAWRMANWRRRAMSEPLPKEFVMLAWKARVGYSSDNNFTQVACDFHR